MGVLIMKKTKLLCFEDEPSKYSIEPQSLDTLTFPLFLFTHCYFNTKNSCIIAYKLLRKLRIDLLIID